MDMSIAIPSLGCFSTLDTASDRSGFAGLVPKQINRMASMVPEQMIGPIARQTERIRVGTAKKVCLDIHLLDSQLGPLLPCYGSIDGTD